MYKYTIHKQQLFIHHLVRVVAQIRSTSPYSLYVTTIPNIQCWSLLYSTVKRQDDELQAATDGCRFGSNGSTSLLRRQYGVFYAPYGTFKPIVSHQKFTSAIRIINIILVDFVFRGRKLWSGRSGTTTTDSEPTASRPTETIGSSHGILDASGSRVGRRPHQKCALFGRDPSRWLFGTTHPCRGYCRHWLYFEYRHCRPVQRRNCRIVVPSQ